MAFAGARRSKSRPFAQRENPAPRVLCFRRLLADDELPDFSGRKEMKSTKFIIEQKYLKIVDSDTDFDQIRVPS